MSVYVDNPLYRARVARGLSLSRLAALTCLSPRILAKLDAGDFGALPGGVYARSYVRAYASAVGLDPDRIVEELSAHLPPAEDPLPAMREVRTALPDPWAFADRIGERAGALRDCIAAALQERAFQRPPLRRWLAGTVDAALLLAVYASIVWIAFRVTGRPLPEDTLPYAALAVVWAVIAFVYLIVFAGIAGRTPGARICGAQPAPPARPLDLDAILRRAFAWAAAPSDGRREERCGGDHGELLPGMGR